MIKMYTGTPGAGKSLHAIQQVLGYLESGRNVIANFPIKFENLKLKHRHGKFFYVPNERITVNYLYQFNSLYHVENEENQTLLIIDEASVKFNCRTSLVKDRLNFCSFFAQHRKFGFGVILISQNMKQIDRQIRDLVEIEVIHRKLNNFSFYRFLPFPLFVAVERNVSVKQKNDHEFFLYNKYFGNMYDTFYDFTTVSKFTDVEQLVMEVENSLLYDSSTEIFSYPRSLLSRIWGSVSGAPNRDSEDHGEFEDSDDGIFTEMEEIICI